MTSPEDILKFWFGEKSLDVEAAFMPRLWLWFSGDTWADREAKATFSPAFPLAVSGELDGWAETPRGRLALILLLDQAPRQLFRGTAQAFAYDDRALALADDGVDKGMDRELALAERVFFNMPRGHSEVLEIQRRGCDYIHAMFDEAPPFYRRQFSAIAKKHVWVLERFGRFPQRNAALGRESTPEEQAYLDEIKAAGKPF